MQCQAAGEQLNCPLVLGGDVNVHVLLRILDPLGVPNLISQIVHVGRACRGLVPHPRLPGMQTDAHEVSGRHPDGSPNPCRGSPRGEFGTDGELDTQTVPSTDGESGTSSANGDDPGGDVDNVEPSFEDLAPAAGAVRAGFMSLDTLDFEEFFLRFEKFTQGEWLELIFESATTEEEASAVSRRRGRLVQARSNNGPRGH